MELPDTPDSERIADELNLLAALVPLTRQHIIELGCGKAAMARQMVRRFEGCRVTGLEVDERQLARNLSEPPTEGLSFVRAGAQAIPFADGSFDQAMMLKSLHHVPLDLLDQALAEAWRVLRAGGHLYISEPVFAGAFNEVMRLFHDESLVRRAAYAAIRRSVAGGRWTEVTERHFHTPVTFRDFAEFEQRMIHVTFAEHRLGAATLAAVRARFEAHMTPDGAHFLRPMRVNLLRKSG
jgi:ubiquinone/menaquinone biosynthesis C-methylase UbiE